MLKTIEGKEVDAFEQEMEHRIANLKTMVYVGGHIEKEYIAGVKRGYEYTKSEQWQFISGLVYYVAT